LHLLSEERKIRMTGSKISKFAVNKCNIRHTEEVLDESAKCYG
jgi:hypothetical protein